MHSNRQHKRLVLLSGVRRPPAICNCLNLIHNALQRRRAPLGTRCRLKEKIESTPPTTRSDQQAAQAEQRQRAGLGDSEELGCDGGATDIECRREVRPG